jgi:hypothetical protein
MSTSTPEVRIEPIVAPTPAQLAAWLRLWGFLLREPVEERDDDPQK